MQTIFSVECAQIQRIEISDTFQEYDMYKRSFPSRQRVAVRERARNGALTISSLLWIFADLQKPQKRCKDQLSELCKAGVLARLEIWHGDQRSGIAYTISTVFKERFYQKISALRYLEKAPDLMLKLTATQKIVSLTAELRKHQQNEQERQLTVEEQLEWLSIATLTSKAKKYSYETNKLFPMARIKNGMQQVSYVVISCRKNQELLPRLLFLMDQIAGRAEWKGIVIFESFCEMQQEMAKVLHEVGKLKNIVYGTFDRACIDSQKIYRVEYISGSGTTFAPVSIQMNNAPAHVLTNGRGFLR